MNNNNYQGPEYPNTPPTQSNYPPQQVKTSSKAITSLILGIVSLVALPIGGALLVLGTLGFFSGIAAIVLAALSFKEIKRGQAKGMGMAIAGLACGSVATTFNLLAFVISFIIGFMSAANGT